MPDHAAPGPPPDAEELAAYDYLDTVDPLDTSQLTYVHVHTGEILAGTGEPCAVIRPGFLLADDGRTFRVRFIDFSQRRLTRRVADDRFGPVNWEPADLAADARMVANRIRWRSGRTVHDRLLGWYGSAEIFGDVLISDHAQAWMMARACAARGLGREAHELALAAAPGTRREPSTDPRQMLQQELAIGRWQQILLALSDRTATRGEVVALCRQYAALFAARRDNARLLAEQIVSQLADDQATVLASSADSAGAASERIRGWIRELRDQADPVSEESAATTLGPRLNGQTARLALPSTRLRDAGLAAIPLLIDAIADSRPTRIVQRQTGSLEPGDDYRLVSVGEAAFAIVCDVLGEPVGIAAPARGDDSTAVQAALRSQYERALRDGLDAVLIRRIVECDGDCLRAARALARRAPEKARTTLLDRIRHTTDVRERVLLMNLAAKVGGEAVVAMLCDRLDRGPTWSDVSESPAPAAVELLLSTGSPEAVAVLCDPGPTGCDPRVLADSLASWPVAGAGESGERAVQHAAADAMIEDYLIRALGAAERDGDDEPFAAASRRAACARALAQRWSTRYHFDADAPVALQRRQIERLRLGASARRGSAVSRPVPARTELADGNTVAEVVLDPRGQPPSPVLLPALGRLVHQQLDALKLVACFRGAIEDVAPDRREVRLFADRAGDGAGVMVALATPPTDVTFGSRPSRLSLTVTIDARVQHDSTVLVGPRPEDVAEAFARLLPRIDAALRAPATEAVTIRLAWTPR